MKIDCTYVWITFRRNNFIELFESFELTLNTTVMHTIKRWFICWMIDDWVKIWFLLKSLYICTINRDFSKIFFVFSFLISFTKRALKIFMFWKTSLTLTNLKIFFLIIRRFLSVLKRWIEMKFRSKNNLNSRVRHRKNHQTWNQNHSSKNKCLIQWRNWFELKFFLIFHDRV